MLSSFFCLFRLGFYSKLLINGPLEILACVNQHQPVAFRIYPGFHILCFRAGQFTREIKGGSG
jgi:hypothetical protein